ncbi:plastocyanin/azurin family copper-binding protein (plasmid) [Deinococcus radiomollis]|uniref:cupredoxin domain-containing protein n=1 Tax=Deinococcus radiomollis TaxID=468916 RepID=UPI003891FC6F
MSRLSSIIASALLVGSANAAALSPMIFPFKVEGTASPHASGQLLVRTLSPTSSLSVINVHGLIPNTAYVAHYHSLGPASSDPCASNGPISLVFPPFKTDAQGNAISLLRAVPARISGTAGAYVNVHTAADVGVIPLCASVLKAGTAVPVTPQTKTAEPSKQTGQQAIVKIGDDFFAPTALSVTAGTTVTWIHTGKVSHNVSSVELPGIHSATLHPGESYSYTFTTPGTYTYYCSFHDMNGTITVTNR